MADLQRAKELLAQLATALDATGGSTVSGPALSYNTPLNLIEPYEARAAAVMEYIENGVFVKDYWRHGDIGAQAGASALHHAEARSTAYSWAGDIPHHMSIIVAVPAGSYWVDGLRSVADIGWRATGMTDPRDYRYDPLATDNYQRWVRAGCPHANAVAAYDNAGRVLPMNQWAAVYERMRQQGLSV